MVSNEVQRQISPLMMSRSAWVDHDQGPANKTVRMRDDDVG